MIWLFEKLDRVIIIYQVMNNQKGKTEERDRLISTILPKEEKTIDLKMESSACSHENHLGAVESHPSPKR